MKDNKPILQPPGPVPDQSVANPKQLNKTGLALIVMIILAVTVVVYLPRLELGNPSTNDTAGVPYVEPQAVEVKADSVGQNLNQTDANTRLAARTEAQKSLRAFLRLRARLELENAPQWAAQQWQQALTLINRADRFFGQGDFADAQDAYRQALDLLTTIEGSRAQRLASALKAGQLALENEDIQKAIEPFEFAILIEPNHPIAAKGLARSRVRDEVLNLMQAGRNAEATADLSVAHDAYAQAYQLDDQYLPALESRQRLNKLINDKRFRQAMSEAINALESGKLNESNKALDITAQLKPDDPAQRDLAKRLLAMRKQRTLTALRNQSQQQAKLENWQSAAELYRKALLLSPVIAFAKQGLIQAQDKIRLHQQLDHYLLDRQRLFADQPLANAQSLLQSAGKAYANEPKLMTKITDLSQQVRAAQTPVSVKLQSDGKTKVVIYRVGRQGQFEHHEIELLPRTYTAIGSRIGYRDVRKVFDVEPGAALQTIVIQCEEPI